MIGSGTSFTKYCAEYYATKDHQKINQIISTGFVIYFILARFLLAIIVLAMNPLLQEINFVNRTLLSTIIWSKK